MRWRLADDDAGQGALFDGDELLDRHVGKGEYRGLEFLHVNARTIVNEVPAASRLPFRWTINAYRGCSHACTYCFARPTHAWLDLDIGRDFEQKIVVKVNAVERLRAELAARRWAGEPIAMGTNTDPYQKAEGKYHLTRGIIEVLGERANPFSILTKSTLILRDLDVLTEAAARSEVKASFSIGTLDRDVWRMTEPGTPPPWKRVEAVAKLNEAGIPTGVLVAPVLPGLSDSPDQLEEVVRACVEAGATSISPLLLHLRPGVREHYLTWLAGTRPDLVERHEQLYPRAYASKDEQHKLSTLVRRLVDRHGGVPGSRMGHRQAAAPTRPTPRPTPRPKPKPKAKDSPNQLSMGLG